MYGPVFILFEYSFLKVNNTLRAALYITAYTTKPLIISNISHTLVGNDTVDHSDAVEALSVDAARITSTFST